MTNTNGEKQAVILSGGGAYGAYEVGVLKVLFADKSPATDEKPLKPDIFSGASVRFYNAAFLVSRWGMYGTAAIGSLKEGWLGDSSNPPQKPDNSVFRLLNDPGSSSASKVSSRARCIPLTTYSGTALVWDGMGSRGLSTFCV